MLTIVIHIYAFHRINWKIDSIESVEINNNHERANFDVNGNLPSLLLLNGFFGMKFFYGSSALRASDPPKNFIPQQPFISNLEGKFPFTSKGSLMINIFLPEFAFFVPGKYENFGDRKYARLKSCSSSANGDTNDGVNEAFGKKYSYYRILRTVNFYFP